MSSTLKALYRIGFFQFIFYIIAIFWIILHKIPKDITIKDILNIFYFKFLKVPTENCEIIEMNNYKLVTRCNNECIILKISLRLGLDTRESCKKISEGPCKFFLKRISQNINFKRNYNHIRPNSPSCEEEITLGFKKI